MKTIYVLEGTPTSEEIRHKLIEIKDLGYLALRVRGDKQLYLCEGVELKSLAGMRHVGRKWLQVRKPTRMFYHFTLERIETDPRLDEATKARKIASLLDHAERKAVKLFCLVPKQALSEREARRKRNAMVRQRRAISIKAMQERKLERRIAI